MRNSIFLLFFISNAVQAQCHLTKRIISLSAPVTASLREWGIINDPMVQGISTFHYAPEFNGTKIPGGVYLGEKYLKDRRDVVIFFDKSQDIRKRLRSLKTIEIETTSSDPFQLQTSVIEELKPFLLNCEDRVKIFLKKMESIRTSLLKTKIKSPIYFFLGEIKKSDWPSLIINNDGFVAWLKKEKLIETFVSDLNFVKWSEAWKKNLSKDAILIGLIQDKSHGEIEILKISEQESNIKGADILAPGWGQIQLLKYLSTLNI